MAIFVACSKSTGDQAQPGATLGTEPPRTTTTAPYAVPAVIDVAYITRVITGLDALKGDVTRLVINSKTIPREAFDRLKAMYADAGLNRELDSYARDLADGLQGYRESPGNKRSAVKDISVSPACVFSASSETTAR